MSNPILTATRGKGLLPMIARGRVIASRYGLTSEKMNGALAALITILTRYACSATIPITASALASNPKALKKGSFHGVEMAIHGLHHTDYSMLRYERQLAHINRAREIFNGFGLPINGFRCPYLRWNADTLTVLKETGFVYDSSQALALDVVGTLSTDRYRRALDFYRAQSASDYPALPSWSDDLIRIPYCLPDDEALVDRLHIRDAELMADIWLAVLDRTYQAGELFTLGLHPERASMCATALQAILTKARSLNPGVWVARLDEIAGWFRVLGEATCVLEHDGDDVYRVNIHASQRSTVLARSTDVFVDLQAWTGDYHVVSTHEFLLRSEKRPLIGISPDTSISCQRLLRHHGYLIEVSSNPEEYPIYLDRRSFRPEDERPLLAILEAGQGPLVRLSRWPDAARCALAITGDLDAFTIWDFGRRILAG